MNRSDKIKEDIINFLSITGDLMALNGLWLLCSIPIITIGPSTSALYKVCLKLVKEGSCPVLKTFFQAFKENFTQALILGAFSLFLIVIMFGDVTYILSISGAVQIIYIVLAIITTAVLLIMVTYGNGLLVSYKNTFKNHIINAFKLAFVNPIETITMWIIIAVPFGLIYLFFTNELMFNIILYVCWFFIIFLSSLPTYLICKVLNKVFDKFKKEK